MASQNATLKQRLTGAWALLFPLTYLVHIAEEYYGGEGFPSWLSRVAGVDLTPARFLGLNAFALVLMTIGIVLALSSKAMGWLVTSFGMVVSINAVAHLVGNVITRSYSPGLVSGVLLWLPLGIFTLRRSWTLSTRRSFWTGVGVGILIHGIISLLAFSG